MKNEFNSNHLLDFISCLDFGLPQNYFNKELWSENSLSKALWALDRDSNLLVLWKTILNKMHVTSVDQNLAFDLLFLFVKKFTKKRCYLFGISWSWPKCTQRQLSNKAIVKKYDLHVEIKQKTDPDAIDKSKTKCHGCGDLGH